jgi:hypothetical protein
MYIVLRYRRPIGFRAAVLYYPRTLEPEFYMEIFGLGHVTFGLKCEMVTILYEYYTETIPGNPGLNKVLKKTVHSKLKIGHFQYLN